MNHFLNETLFFLLCLFCEETVFTRKIYKKTSEEKDDSLSKIGKDVSLEVDDASLAKKSWTERALSEAAVFEHIYSLHAA